MWCRSTKQRRAADRRRRERLRCYGFRILGIDVDAGIVHVRGIGDGEENFEVDYLEGGATLH